VAALGALNLQSPAAGRLTDESEDHALPSATHAAVGLLVVYSQHANRRLLRHRSRANAAFGKVDVAILPSRRRGATLGYVANVV